MKKLFNKRPQRCSLCRTRAVFGQFGGLHQVQCPDCGMHTHSFGTRQLAVAAWNCRV